LGDHDERQARHRGEGDVVDPVPHPRRQPSADGRNHEDPHADPQEHGFGRVGEPGGHRDRPKKRAKTSVPANESSAVSIATSRYDVRP